MRVSVACAFAQRSFCTLCLIVGTGLTGAASAEPDSGLAAVVITATRTSEPVADTLSSVTVLDEQVIARRQVLSLQELFQGEAGIQINNNGGLGKVTSLFVRGTEAEQVLVLIDGVKVGSATLGSTAFQYLPIDEIERVEIVRGPRSSLYGSEAVGGVIQILTRQAQDGLTTAATAATGSHGTQTVGARLAERTDKTTFSLSGSYVTSDGYPNCRGVPYPPGGGCYTYDPRPDGYHNAAGAVRLGYQFADSADVQASLLRAQGGTRYAGLSTNHEDFVQQAAAVSGHWSPAPTLRVTALVGESRDYAVDTLDFVESPGNRFDTTRNNASAQADWQLATHHLVTFGGDYLLDQLSSDTPFPVTSRRVTGLFGEYQGSAGAQQWSLSTRHDDNQQFGGKTTGGAAWGYRFGSALRFMASFGTAFRAPSFDDLYFPGFGNPNLRPETSRSFELGLDRLSAAGRWSIHGFDTRIHELIGFDANFIAANTDEARIRGVEAQGATTLGPWEVTLNAAWLDARNTTPGSANFNNLLPRRARETARLELARQFAHLRVATRVNAAGPRFDDLANMAPLGGYTTADVLLEWTTPSRRWAVQAKFANVTAHRYELALYYPQDGRNYLITVRYHPAAST